ncbi:hypothetical protein VP01_58g3 [Puccinia sorghi]|uniref:Uncharacterized protein n=1 Tax=Puccinia sorghi TaxID=27349 RepID=A0A0L6UJX1_9BASI|nr:hypothetical protein VP01_58g3 [Puccinia sorghi]
MSDPAIFTVPQLRFYLKTHGIRCLTRFSQRVVHQLYQEHLADCPRNDRKREYWPAPENLDKQCLRGILKLYDVDFEESDQRPRLVALYESLKVLRQD